MTCEERIQVRARGHAMVNAMGNCMNACSGTSRIILKTIARRTPAVQCRKSPSEKQNYREAENEE